MGMRREAWVHQRLASGLRELLSSRKGTRGGGVGLASRAFTDRKAASASEYLSAKSASNSSSEKNT